MKAKIFFIFVVFVNIKIINLGGNCDGEDEVEGYADDSSSSSSSSDDEPEQVQEFSIMDNLSILKSIDVDFENNYNK